MPGKPRRVRNRWTDSRRLPRQFATIACDALSAAVRPEKLQRPLLGELRAGFVIIRAPVRVEPVPRRIDIDLHVWMRRLDLVHHLHRDAVILLAEMADRRAFR